MAVLILDQTKEIHEHEPLAQVPLVTLGENMGMDGGGAGFSVN
jgi:hypothetical protein